MLGLHTQSSPSLGDLQSEVEVTLVELLNLYCSCVYVVCVGMHATARGLRGQLCESGLSFHFCVSSKDWTLHLACLASTFT